jgi:hypothetical protein
MVSDVSNKQWDAFVKSISKLPGYANAAELSITDLVGKIITTGTNTNTSAKSAADWGKVLEWVGLVINALPTVKELTYNIRMNYIYGSTGDKGLIEKAQDIYARAHGGRRYNFGTGAASDEAGWDAAMAQAKKNNPAPTIPTVEMPEFPKLGGLPGASASSSGGSTASTGVIDVPDEWKEANVDVSAYLKTAVAWAKKYQHAIPGEDKAHVKDLVAVMDENKRVLLQKGIAEEYLKKAMDELTAQIKKQNDLLSKADTIRRIRVGAGDFAALANVPMNSQSGVSIGGSEGPISVNIDVNGQLLTPAQMDQLVEKVAAAIKAKLS